MNDHLETIKDLLKNKFRINESVNSKRMCLLSWKSLIKPRSGFWTEMGRPHEKTMNVKKVKNIDNLMGHGSYL